MVNLPVSAGLGIGFAPEWTDGLPNRAFNPLALGYAFQPIAGIVGCVPSISSYAAACQTSTDCYALSHSAGCSGLTLGEERHSAGRRGLIFVRHCRSRY
ncbi:hypothetical protein ELH63_29040 (plasmid) [Rhizobium ruizarguesonis]|nr:hypothetical protein ELH63_29040 [Rhizobium ruizarguesonis]